MRSFKAVALVLLVALIGCGAWFAWRLAHPSEEERIVRSTADVITAVRDLARLEGAEFQLERVISLTDEQSHLYGLVKVKDAILLVAAGSVTAGVDLSQLRDGDVSVNPKTHAVRFSLPDSTVFRATLDSEHTYVYQRDTDLLASRKESLEADARQEAERTLRAAAEKGGIVDRSNQNVKKTLESLSRSLGFTEVTVEFHPPPLFDERRK